MLELLVVALNLIQTTMAQHIPYIHAVKKPLTGQLHKSNLGKFGAKLR